MLSQIEKNRISSAVKSAEEGVSGEIVPFLVDKSGDYSDSLSLATVLLFFVTGLEIFWRQRSWAPQSYLYEAIFLGLGLILIIAKPTRMMFIRRKTLALATLARARQAFVELEVFKTRQRTGILIFVSLLERQVIVLCDSGINSKVAQDQWDQLADGISLRVKTSGVTEALCWGIEQSRGLLLEKGFRADSADNPNEISNEPQQEKHKS